MDEELPPIIVHRPTMRVIDGAHRLRAAELRARRHIEVRFFDGDEDDAFVLAVEANTANGLALSVEDRKAAAARIIVTHPARSDRWIASVAGLAATTVGALRKCSSVSDTQSNKRVGLDGRTRPLDSSEGRRLAGELMRSNPNRSLRDIARAVGIAPSTVLDVRNRLSRGADAVPARRENPVKASGTGRDPGAPRRQGGSRATLDLPPDAIMRTLRQDPSLRFNEAGRALLRWLDKHNVAGQAPPPLGDVPMHCLSAIAALAQHNAKYWAELGDRVATLDADPLPTEGAG
ncbi:ParB/RepB/Spo0J family partition protein [Amycolatopsis sp. NPDC049252]|uniref:ParB/RepB/Spo0J family partition protein n=1 Tax=Amycolatopsis sp. NPDC049252 TaxID=3363933 RepID=UPI003718BBA0